MNEDILRFKFQHDRDQFLVFDEPTHKYQITCDLSSVYTSVTSWNHIHFEPFEPSNVIDNMMKGKNWNSSPYYGKSKEEIIEQWKISGNEASTAGTTLHKNIESFMNQPLPYEDGVPIRHHHLLEYYYTFNEISTYPIRNHSKEWAFFLQFVKDTPELRPYRTEWMIWDDELKLAGSIDMIYENEDGTLSIYDWKRVKAIVKSKEVARFNTYAKTPAISHIIDTNFWHYSMQLNTYKALLHRKYGKIVTDLFLVRLHPNSENYELIPLPDLQTEIHELFTLLERETKKKDSLNN